MLPSLLDAVSDDTAALRTAALQLLLCLERDGWLRALDAPNESLRGAPSKKHKGNATGRGRSKQGAKHADAPSTSRAEPADCSAAGDTLVGSESALAPESALARALALALEIEAAPSAPNSKQLVVDAEGLCRLARASGGGGGTAGAERCARLLSALAMGMLQIRFARVWPLAHDLMRALGDAGHAEGTEPPLWTAIYAKLERAHAPGALWPPTAAEAQATEGDDDEGGGGDESASIPSLGERALRTRWRDALAPPRRGADRRQLGAQLLGALSGGGTLHKMALRHGAALVRIWQPFASAVRSDAERFQPEPRLPSAEEEEAEAAEEEAEAIEEEGVGGSEAKEAVAADATTARAAPEEIASSSALRGLLLAWLKLHASVDAPRKLSGAASTYETCACLVGHADPKVQSQALEALAKWQQPPLLAHKDSLLALITDKTFRETLARFPVDTETGVLKEEQRTLILPLLSRLLFAKLTQRSGRGASKNAMAQRRASIFAYFCGYRPKELRPLIDLVLAPLAAVGAAPSAAGGVQLAAARLAEVPGTQQLGVLRSIHEALAQLGGALRPYGEELLAALEHMFLFCSHCACAAEGAADGTPTPTLPTEAPLALIDPSPLVTLPPAQAREERLWCLKVLKLLLGAIPPPALEYGGFMRTFWGCAAPVLRRLHTHHTQSPAGLLSLLLQMARERETLPLLADATERGAGGAQAPLEVLPCVYACLAAPKCAKSVLEAVLELVEALLAHSRRELTTGDEAAPPNAAAAAMVTTTDAALVTACGTATDPLAPAIASTTATAATASSAKSYAVRVSGAVPEAESPPDASAEAAAVAAEALLLAHMPQLLEQLHTRLNFKFGGTDAARALAGAGAGESATRELRLLAKLSPYVTSAQQAQQLLELFLPYLRLKSTARAERLKESVIQLITRLLRLVSQPERHLRFFGLQFGALRSRGAREALCHLWEALPPLVGDAGGQGESLRRVAHMLHELNAFSIGTVNELDYDRRIDAYGEVAAQLKSGALEPSLALPILCQCLHDLELDDMALRHSASHAAALLVRHAAVRGAQVEADDASATAVAPAAPPAPAIPAASERSAWAGLLANVLMPALRRGLRLPPERELVRAEMVRLLSVALEARPALQPEMATLCTPSDSEADFFYNLAHVQLPRRQRALARLRARLSEGVFSAPTIAGYLVPLLTDLVLRRSAKELDVAETAVETLREAAARLGWRPYLQLLLGFIRSLKLQPYLERRVVRAMVAVLDVFPFDISEEEDPEERAEQLERLRLERQEQEQQREQPRDQQEEAGEQQREELRSEGRADGEQGVEEEEEDEVIVSALGAEGDADAEAAAAADAEAAAARQRVGAIRKTIRRTVLPQLYAHMKDPKTEGTRVPVALGVLKLLLLMPPSVLAAELRGFLIRLVSAIGHRDKGVRSSARDTLAKVAVELGAEYFGAVVHELRTTLRRGFELHVLGYTLHHLLARLVPTVDAGSLDGCAPEVVKLLMADVFGEAAEKKEVEAIANSMKEARATQSFASFELLASNVAFVPTVNALVPAVHQAALDAPGGADSLKNVANARELLRRGAIGFVANPTTSVEPLCVYVRGLLATHLPPRAAAAGGAGGAAGSSGEGRAGNRSGRAAPVDSVLAPALEAGVSSGVGRTPLSHELSHFSLTLLLGALKKGRFDARDPRHLGLLEPLLPLLQTALRCDADAVVVSALRALGGMLDFPLPSLPHHASALLDRTLQLLKRSSSFKGSELQAVGLKVITALLRKPPAAAAADQGGADGGSAEESAATAVAEPSGASGALGAAGESAAPTASGGARLNEPQLRWLLSFISTHLDDTALQGALFGILRVIFARRFVLAEIYDLVLVLGEHALQAEAEGVRATCGNLYLVFLLHYPLGPKRLQQHLDFILGNLAYPVAHGRLSLLVMVRTMLAKLPLQLLHEQSNRLLFSLVARLGSEEEQKCCAAVGDALRQLLARTCAVGATAAVADAAGCDAARARTLKLVGAWCADETQPTLVRAAVQLAGLLVEALGETGGVAVAAKLAPMLVARCVREAERPSGSEDLSPSTARQGEAAAESEHGGEVAAVGEGALDTGWQPAYFSLRTLLKLEHAQPQLVMARCCAPLWQARVLHPLLLHSHAWVRGAAGRLLGELLARVEPEMLLLQPSKPSTDAQPAPKGGAGKGKKNAAAATVPIGAIGELCERGALLRLGDALLQQLYSPLLDEAASAQTLKNLLWLTATLQRRPELAPRDCAETLRGTRGVQNAASASGAPRHRDLFDPTAVAEAATEDLENDLAEESDEDEAANDSAANGAANGAAEASAHWPLTVMAARIGPLVRSAGHVRGCAALAWIGALVSTAEPAVLHRMLGALLRPAVLASEDQSGKVHGRVRERAGEVLQLLQRRADPPAWASEYQRFKEAQKTRVRERKRKAALEAVADPATAALKRMAKNLGKRKAKGRKLQTMKRQRDTNGSVGVGKKRRK